MATIEINLEWSRAFATAPGKRAYAFSDGRIRQLAAEHSATRRWQINRSIWILPSSTDRRLRAWDLRKSGDCSRHEPARAMCPSHRPARAIRPLRI